MLLVSFFDDGGFSGMENEPLSEKLLMTFCLILLPLLSIAFLVSGVEGLVKRIKIKKGILDEKEEQLKEQKKIEELDRKLSDINLFSEVSIAVSVLSLFYTDKYPVTKEIRRKKLPKSIRKILTTFLFYAFFICLGLFWDVNGRPGNHNNYFIIGIGLIISILVTWLTLKFDKTGKKTVALGMSAEDFCYHAVKYHNVYLKMIEKNGYTSHTIEKADSAIESYREGANISILYLKNYILLPAEYSMIKGYYNRALDYLNVINPEMLLNPDLLV